MNGWSWPRRVEASLKAKPPTAPQLRQNVIFLFSCAIFAVILWMYVAGLEPDANPDHEDTREIPSQTIHFTADKCPFRILDQDTTSVTVTVRGMSSELAHPFVDVIVDLDHITTPGLHSLPVVLKTADSVTATATPDHVNVFLDTTKTRVLPVLFHSPHQPLPDYEVGHPVSSPESVTVTGPASLMDEARVVTEFDVKDITHDVSVVLPLHLAGVPEAVVHLFTIKPTTVMQYVPVDRKLSHATVPVSPHVIALPAAGYILRRVRVNPPTVTISGRPNLVDNVTSVSTTAISLAGATRSFGQLVELAPPDGVQVDGDTTVRLHFEIERAPAPPPTPPEVQIPPVNLNPAVSGGELNNPRLRTPPGMGTNTGTTTGTTEAPAGAPMPGTQP